MDEKGTERMKNIYWNGLGLHQGYCLRIMQYIPRIGSIDISALKDLEKFRMASNIYHDVYNNGLCNYRNEFEQIFFKLPEDPILYKENDINQAVLNRMEECMHDIIIKAYENVRVYYTVD